MPPSAWLFANYSTCRCWSLRVLTWLCFYAYLVTQQPSAFLRFKVFTQPLRSLVGDSTSSFRLSFGFKVFVRIRFGWDSAILLALSSSLWLFWLSRFVRFAVSATCLLRFLSSWRLRHRTWFQVGVPPRRFHGFLSLPISRFSQPSYGFSFCALVLVCGFVPPHWHL